MEPTVRDTILYVPDQGGLPFRVTHPKTRDRMRLTDGIKPEVFVRKVSKKEMNRLWKK